MPDHLTGYSEACLEKDLRVSVSGDTIDELRFWNNRAVLGAEAVACKLDLLTGGESSDNLDTMNGSILNANISLCAKAGEFGVPNVLERSSNIGALVNLERSKLMAIDCDTYPIDRMFRMDQPPSDSDPFGL